jgi:hypothetical protein
MIGLLNYAYAKRAFTLATPARAGMLAILPL